MGQQPTPKHGVVGAAAQVAQRPYEVQARDGVDAAAVAAGLRVVDGTIPWSE